MQSLAWKVIVVALVFFAAAYFIPWHSVSWGKFELVPASTITVTGDAKSDQANQVASFNASVTSTNANKQTAVDDVNTKMTDLVQALKVFGIDSSDIKTESVSVNQMEVYNPSTGKSTPGDWRASNSISIKLKDIAKASDLTKLLTNSGATNINGPNYSVDNTQTAQVDLMSQAIANARQKAEAIATASGKKLGSVISVTEGATSQTPLPLMALEGRGGGTPLEPGTATVSQSVTVTFELK